jgi:hypothetical protein
LVGGQLDYGDYVCGIVLSGLKRKVKDRQHIASISMIEDPSNADGGEESTKEKEFYAF